MLRMTANGLGMIPGPRTSHQNINGTSIYFREGAGYGSIVRVEWAFKNFFQVSL
jgi:hypothetical protein